MPQTDSLHSISLPKGCYFRKLWNPLDTHELALSRELHAGWAPLRSDTSSQHSIWKLNIKSLQVSFSHFVVGILCLLLQIGGSKCYVVRWIPKTKEYEHAHNSAVAS